MSVNGMEYEDVEGEPENLKTDAPAEQQTLFDLSGKKFRVNFVDEKSSLYIPNNTLHWKAYKLQQMITRLENQAARNPAQFNSGNFMELIDRFEAIVKEINEDSMGSSEVGGDGDEEAAHEVGSSVPLGVGAGISADNPIAG